MEENKEKDEELKETKDIQCEIIDETEELIKQLLQQGISMENLEILYKLVDIHKDINNEIYWKIKESEIMYGNYGNYNGYNDGYNNYSRYNEYNDGYGRERYGEYGRRGVDSKYRGHEHMDRMYNNYNRYEEGREQYNRGNYNAKGDTLKSLEYMLESATDFFKMLKNEASSPEEQQLVKEYTKRISEM